MEKSFQHDLGAVDDGPCGGEASARPRKGVGLGDSRKHMNSQMILPGRSAHLHRAVPSQGVEYLIVTAHGVPQGCSCPSVSRWLLRRSW